MGDQKHYFRNKQITKRQKFHQKILRPLALWIASHPPQDFIANGVVWVGFSILIPWFVLQFFSFTMALPWILIAVFLTLAGISYALRKGGR